MTLNSGLKSNVCNFVIGYDVSWLDDLDSFGSEMFHLFFKVINTMFEDAKRQGCRASRLLFLLQNHAAS